MQLNLIEVSKWLLSQTKDLTYIEISEPDGSCIFQSNRVENSPFRPQQIEYISGQYSSVPEKKCRLVAKSGDVVYCLLSDAIAAYRSLALKNKSNL